MHACMHQTTGPEGGLNSVHPPMAAIAGLCQNRGDHAYDNGREELVERRSATIP